MKKLTKSQRREKYLSRQLRFKGNGIIETPRIIQIRGDAFDTLVEKSWDEGWKAKTNSLK